MCSVFICDYAWKTTASNQHRHAVRTQGPWCVKHKTMTRLSLKSLATQCVSPCYGCVLWQYSRPVYIQIRVHFLKTLYFLRKVTASSVFSHGPGTVTSHTGSMRKIWRLHYAGLRFASWQEHLFPRCFGVFCISSFLSHFVLSENNLKIISTWPPENGERSYFAAEIQLSLALTGPRIQYRDYTKRQLKTDTMAARGCEINTCATENPDLGIFHAGLIFASWQEHLFPHCFGTFSISFFSVSFCS